MRQLSDLESTVSQLRSELREAKRMYEDKVSLNFAVLLPETIIHKISQIIFNGLFENEASKQSFKTKSSL